MTDYTATAFLDTDPSAVLADIARLGLTEAAQYNLELAHGDEEGRWSEVTEADMLEAVTDLRDEHRP